MTPTDNRPDSGERGALDIGDHKCVKIADFQRYEDRGTEADGHERHCWIGRLVEPLKDAPGEVFCLHIKTGWKPPMVFGLNEADLEFLAALSLAALGRHINPSWLESIAASAISDARSSGEAIEFDRSALYGSKLTDRPSSTEAKMENQVEDWTPTLYEDVVTALIREDDGERYYVARWTLDDLPEFFGDGETREQAVERLMYATVSMLVAFADDEFMDRPDLSTSSEEPCPMPDCTAERGHAGPHIMPVLQPDAAPTERSLGAQMEKRSSEHIADVLVALAGNQKKRMDGRYLREAARRLRAGRGEGENFPPRCPKCCQNDVYCHYREKGEWRDLYDQRQRYGDKVKEECFDLHCRTCGYDWIVPTDSGGSDDDE